MSNQVTQRGFGVFPDLQQAEQTLHTLKESDFPMEQVSIIAKQAEDEQQVEGAEVSDRVKNQQVGSSTGVVKDVSAGALFGSILVGLSSLAIPGVGPILAAGSLGGALLAAITSEGVGAIGTANLVRALKDLGVSSEKAGNYSDRLMAGQPLIIVEGTDESLQQAEAMLHYDVQDWDVYPVE